MTPLLHAQPMFDSTIAPRTRGGGDPARVNASGGGGGRKGIWE